MNFTNIDKGDGEFWCNELDIDTNIEENVNLKNSDFINNFNDINFRENSENSLNSTDSFNSSNIEKFNLHNVKLKKDFIKKDDILTESDNNLMQLELFESTLPKDLSNEKKMSLLIVVLLQMVFKNNDSKLNSVYDFLSKKNLLDIEVTKKKFTGLRYSLSMLISSVNGLNNLGLNNSVNDLNNLELINSVNGLNNLGYNNSTNIEKSDNLTIKEKSYNKFEKTLSVNNKYRTNFVQIKLLGQGAYGSVYKVFHKYEKKFYAIKKIFITKDIIKENYDIFKEIQVYSDLYNENIVRYFGSWVDIDFESIIEYNTQIDIKGSDMYDDVEKHIDYICPILFIQMELCDFTLKDYLLTYSISDNYKDKINIISQIINGLEYLETKNIIHRDIKPDNIFLIEIKNQNFTTCNSSSNKYKVKLGDFGLCKKYFDKNLNKIEVENDLDTSLKYTNNFIDICDNLLTSNQIDILNLMSSNIGTGIYRAPEIDSKNYDYKIDVYSLGIIILELFGNFKTLSEKIILLKKFRNDNNLTVFDFIKNDKIKNMIITTLNLNPLFRPNIENLKKLINEINL